MALMTALAVACIAGVCTIVAAAVAGFGRKVRHDLDACLRERRQLKQVLQLTVGSLVGLLPQAERDRLLVAVADALDQVDEAA